MNTHQLDNQTGTFRGDRRRVKLANCDRSQKPPRTAQRQLRRPWAGLSLGFLLRDDESAQAGIRTGVSDCGSKIRQAREHCVYELCEIQNGPGQFATRRAASSRRGSTDYDLNLQRRRKPARIGSLLLVSALLI